MTEHRRSDAGACFFKSINLTRVRVKHAPQKQRGSCAMTHWQKDYIRRPKVELPCCALLLDLAALQLMSGICGHESAPEGAPERNSHAQSG